MPRNLLIQLGNKFNLLIHGKLIRLHGFKLTSYNLTINNSETKTYQTNPRIIKVLVISYDFALKQSKFWLNKCKDLAADNQMYHRDTFKMVAKFIVTVINHY